MPTGLVLPNLGERPLPWAQGDTRVRLAGGRAGTKKDGRKAVSVAPDQEEERRRRLSTVALPYSQVGAPAIGTGSRLRGTCPNKKAARRDQLTRPLWG